MISRIRIVQLNVVNQHSGNLPFTATVKFQGCSSSVTPGIGRGNNSSIRKPLQALHTSHSKTARRLDLYFRKTFSQSSQRSRVCNPCLDPDFSAGQSMRPRRCNGFVDLQSAVDDLADCLEKSGGDSPASSCPQCHQWRASSFPLFQDDGGCCVGSGHRSRNQLIGMCVARARPQVVVVDKSELRMGDLCSEYGLDRLCQ